MCEAIPGRTGVAGQGRPEASADRWRVWVVMLLMLGLWLFFALPKFLQHAAGETADLDTGNYSHLAWAIANGHGFASSVLHRHHLGEHFSPVMVLVAVPYLFWPSAQVLMFLQATAVWAAVVLVLGQSMRELGCQGVGSRGRWLGAMGLLAMLLVYPAVSATWATQFQPIELGMPLVVLGLLAIRYERVGWLWLIVPLLLSTRESAPLAVAGLGIYAWAGYGRWRLAALLGLVAGVWAFMAMGVVMPHFRGGEEWGHTDYLGWTAAWDEKGQYLAVLLLGLGVFPFLGKRALAAMLGVVPGVILNLSVDRWTQYGFVGHYDAQTAPFLMVAAAHGMGWIAAHSAKLDSVRGRRRYRGAFGVSIGMAVLMWWIAGTMTVVENTKEWWPKPGAMATLAEARVVAQRYADAPGLTAHHRIGPHVCTRPRYLAELSGDNKWEWAWFTSTRIRPGHVFIVPRGDTLARSELPGHLRASGAAELIEVGEYVEVWRWPLDAPEPGTPEARPWATDLYQD